MENQSFFSELYRQWIWIGPLLMVAGIVALGFLIKDLIATVRKAKVCSLPLVAQQHVEFTEPGPVILNLEGPHFSTRFAQPSYVLTTSDGLAIEGSLVLFRSRTSGFSTVSVSYKQYEIPGPGPYILRIEGLGQPRPDDAKHAIVFSRPHRAQSIACILGIILSGGVFIVSLVFFGLRLLEKAPSR